ncbi:hypothetical protein QG053_09220 [Kingella kingae]|nr:hypothetical protein [Kingella kingae]MDK4537423.1 hypothetical protein [Kingella kingae]MDK4539494.1 hypothetical protein [Kingella kingae]MDK4565212.1 hypothetical protein [Kingella kingae]
MPTSLCATCTRRTLSPCPIFISFHYIASIIHANVNLILGDIYGLD